MYIHFSVLFILNTFGALHCCQAFLSIGSAFPQPYIYFFQLGLLSMWLNHTQYGLVPDYLINLLQAYVQSWSLRSADQLILVVPSSKLKHREDHAFAVVACKL